MSKEPKYQTVKNDIKEKIFLGIYPVGEKIPSEAELSELHEVSRHTVRLSISDLVNEGFLRKKQGSGTFVSNDYQEETQTKTNRTIGVITTYVSDYIFPSIVRGIENVLRENNYSLLLSSTQNNTKNEKQSLERMLASNVDGLIIEPTKSSFINPNLNYYLKLKELGIPFVFINSTYAELDAPSIQMDDSGASELATDHLFELGHKKISIITKTDDLQGKSRLNGYVKSYSKRQLAFEQGFIISFETETMNDLTEKIKDLVCSDNRPTAIVCYNDQIALLAISAINECGLKIPDDISIVSHDDSILSTTISDINLTSAVHPKEKMGEDAARWIIDAIENPNERRQSIFYEPKLITRSSSKKIEGN